MKFFGGDNKEGKKEVKEKKAGFLDTLAEGAEGMLELIDVVETQGKEIEQLKAKVDMLEKKLNVVIKHFGG